LNGFRTIDKTDRREAGDLVKRAKLVRDNSRTLGGLVRARRARCAVGPVIWVPVVVLVACLALIALAVLDAPVGAFRKQWPAGITNLARSITDVCESAWYLVPTGVFLLLALMLDWRALSRRSRWLMSNWYAVSAYVFVTIAASGITATLLKRIIGRARPKHFEDHGTLAFDHFATNASFASFPSGHATTAGALMAMIGLLFPWLRGPAIVLAAALASTRIIVGAHYPSDVVAGLALGMWFAYAMALIFAGRGLIFTAGPGRLPVVQPAFARFVAATPLHFLVNVPFLQRFSAKSL
jgi:undecaprenyl-diphosphatase